MHVFRDYRVCLQVCQPGNADMTNSSQLLAFVFGRDSGFFFVSSPSPCVFPAHPVGCEILVLGPGIEPMPPAVEAQVLITGLSGKFQVFKKIKNSNI